MPTPHSLLLSRRGLLSDAAGGLGALAVGALAGGGATAHADGAAAGVWPGAIKAFHVPPKAKRVIWLYMAGGMTHLDTFDHKPKLAEMHGQPMPESFTAGQQIAQLQGSKLTCLAPSTPSVAWGKAVRRSARSFRKSRHGSPIGLRSCVRCTPRRSTTIQPTPS